MTMDDEQLSEELKDDVRADEEAIDAGGDEAEVEARAKAEEEARGHGWKPVDQWKGDKSGWVDADEFLDRLKPARLRETIDRQNRELSELKSTAAQQQQAFADRLARLDKANQTALKRQREQTFANLKAQQRAATEAGDVDAFDELTEIETKVREDFAKEDAEFAEKPAQRQAQQPDPTVDAWVKANPAIAYAPAKWQAAIAFFSESEALNPNASVADHLAHVEERINEAWPGTVRTAKPRGNGNDREQGEDRQARRGPQLDGSSRMPSRQGRQKGFSDIPAEEKAILKRHIGEGLYKDEADAAKTYWRS
jgi:hypothetical protein